MGILPGLVKSHHAAAVVKYPGSFVTPKAGLLPPSLPSAPTVQPPVIPKPPVTASPMPAYPTGPAQPVVADPTGPVGASDPSTMASPPDSGDSGAPQAPLDPNERRNPLPPLYQLNGDDDDESPPVIFLIPYDSGMNGMPTCPQGLMCSAINTDMLTILSTLSDARRLTFSDFL